MRTSRAEASHACLKVEAGCLNLIVNMAAELILVATVK